MAITFVAAGAVASGATAATPANPAGINVGDLILLVVETISTATITTPAGWTALTGSPLTNTGTRLYVWYRISAGTYTAPALASTDHIVARQVAYRGVDTVTPFDVAPTNVTGTGQAVAFAGISPVTANTMIVLVTGRNEDGNSTTAVTPPTGYTERIDNNIGTGGGGGIWLADLIRAATGAYAPPNATAAGGGTYTAFTIALRPLAGAAAANLTLGHLRVSGTATSPRNASANLTLSPFIQTGTATVVSAAGANASANLTLDPLTLSGTTTVVNSGAIASANLTLDPLTLSGTATVASVAGIEASASLTLAPFSLTASAQNAIRAQAAVTLGALSLTASAQNAIRAQAAVTLGALSLTSLAQVPAKAQAAMTLNPLTLSGTTTVVSVAGINASANLTLGRLRVSGTVTSATVNANTLDRRKLFRLRRSTPWRERFYRV